MKTQHKISAPSSIRNSFRGWASKMACAISIGLAMSACTTDQPLGDSASSASSRIDLTPLLALAVAEMEHDIDTARECSMEKKILIACIFV